MENDVVEHGESAEYKTQSLKDFYTAATKRILMTGTFSTIVNRVKKKQQKYPRQQGCHKAPNWP